MILRTLGQQPYLTIWQEMQRFTALRSATTEDEVWLTEHPPIFTLGLNGRREHLLDPGRIPVVAVDRGGQVTYHGPGQLLLYPLIDLRRRHLGVRCYVEQLEASVIALLADYGITSCGRRDAPGVYVAEAKIASIGLRIRQGCSYHGISLNLNPDLTAYQRINPCGYAGLAVTSLSQLGIDYQNDTIGQAWFHHLQQHLSPRVTDDIAR
jgi:lipoyl(octanoyl) transferase